MRRLAAIAALLLALLATAAATTAVVSPALAQSTQPKTSLYEMESQVMCVTCRTPLAVANGPQADSERALISRLIDEGKSPDEIKDALVLEYGERVLALPDDDGFNIAIYVVPIRRRRDRARDIGDLPAALAPSRPRLRGRARRARAGARPGRRAPARRRPQELRLSRTGMPVRPAAADVSRRRPRPPRPVSPSTPAR